MSNKELLALVAAGVPVKTLVQIVTQLSDQYPDPPKSQPQPQAQAQNHSQAPAQNQSQAPAQNQPQLQGPPQTDDFAAIMDSLRDLKQAVIHNNVSNSQQPDTPSVDDFLASIINPNGGGN